MFRFGQTAIPFALMMIMLFGWMSGVIGHFVILKQAYKNNHKDFLLSLLLPLYVAYYALFKFSHRKRGAVLRAFFIGYAAFSLALFLGVQ